MTPDAPNMPHSEFAPDRPIRIRRQPERFTALMAKDICLDTTPTYMPVDYANYPPDPWMDQPMALLTASGIPTPRNYKEAMSPLFCDLWSPSIKVEWEGLVGNHTWDLVPRPRPGESTVPSNKWVFTAG